jgi:hypothetical protein
MNFLRTTLLTTCTLIAISGFSQKKGQDEIIDVTNVTKATFLNPGISYEARIGKKQTLFGQAFMNTSFSYSYSDYFGSDFSLYWDPAFTAQYRYYYNGSRRQEKGKRTAMNSMNYIGTVYEVSFTRAPISGKYWGEENRRALNRIGAFWGFQRNYKGRFSLDLNLGLGYMFGKSTIYDGTGFISQTGGDFSMLGQINFGFWLNKRK